MKSLKLTELELNAMHFAILLDIFAIERHEEVKCCRQRYDALQRVINKIAKIKGLR